MNFQIIAISLLLLSGCQMNDHDKSQVQQSSFFVGTYTSDESKGIYKYILKENGQIEQIGLAAETENPSFLTKSVDNRFLLAVNENNIEGAGSVSSFAIVDDSLKILSQSSSGGAHPCYISVNKLGFVLVANYTGGNVGLLKLNEKGELSDLLDVQQHYGKGSSERQQTPHAHYSSFSPYQNGVISIDLGTNELWFSDLDAEKHILVPSDPAKLKMDSAAGPRHMVYHPNDQWIYVLNELNSSITILSKNIEEKYIKGGSISTLPKDYTEASFCGDIHISSDGKFLYASNRGHDSIAIFEVDEQTGLLKLQMHQETHGNWPRNFSFSPDERYILVANQNSNNIVSFKRNKSTGLLKYETEIEAPTPVCILF